ncbi:uncharacterized protein [Rutidosis leptorrhynchoides]|uniref:uncharacterized protein n=1 Tax=Rutidosis leptorrhynchoides TaxID=125765 RepID=UPI003A99D376
MHWVRWNQVLSSFDYGRLQVGSLPAFNRLLFIKRIWRFFNESSRMWSSVVKAIHGSKAGIDGTSLSGMSTLCHIVKLYWKLKQDELLPANAMRVRAGNELNTKLWSDNWLGYNCLNCKYSRLYHIEVHKDVIIFDRVYPDGWKWVWSRANIGPRNSTIKIESTDHIFLGCDMAREVWHRLMVWMDVHWVDVPYWCELVTSFDSWQSSTEIKNSC